MLQIFEGRAQLVCHDDREIQLFPLEQPAPPRAMALDGSTTTRGTRNWHTHPAAHRRRRVEGTGRRARLLDEQRLVLLHCQTGEQMLVIRWAEAAGAT
ncbi:MAG: hypothetical protein MUE50_08780 [Pirellulaceae bacterium]|nr:hypothetical protein [Pirellulaceae bacterium]